MNEQNSESSEALQESDDTAQLNERTDESRQNEQKQGGQSKESEQQQQQSGESKQKKAKEQEEQVEQQPFPGQQSYSQSLRQYLDSTVVPLLRDGLKKLVQERPEEPVQWLIEYLQNHKDEQSPKSPHQQQNEQ